MVQILNIAFAVLSLLSLWTSFAGLLYCVLKKKNKSGKAWKITVFSFYIFLFFFVAFGIVRNFAMPEWNI